MTEIPDPPAKPACSACMQPLVWLWSPRRETWVAFIPAPAGGPHAITPHPCRGPTDPPTWRTSHPAAPPSAEYLAAKAALTGDPFPTDRAKEGVMTTETPFEAAHRLAPQPATRDTATRDAWIRHYAAHALAALAVFHTEVNAHLAARPVTGSRPDLGYLTLAAEAATAAAAALTDPADAPNLIWDLTPEAGALNGEWQDWLVDTLVKHGVNPGHIDREFNPDDFADDLVTEQINAFQAERGGEQVTA